MRVLTQILLECPDPPEHNLATWDISSTDVPGQIWSGSQITYTCITSHSFKSGETVTRVCGSDGNWNNNVAPVCVPSKLTN